MLGFKEATMVEKSLVKQIMYMHLFIRNYWGDFNTCFTIILSLDQLPIDNLTKNKNKKCNSLKK